MRYTRGYTSHAIKSHVIHGVRQSTLYTGQVFSLPNPNSYILKYKNSLKDLLDHLAGIPVESRYVQT